MISVHRTLFLHSFSRIVERAEWINHEYHTGFYLFLEQSRVSSRPWNIRRDELYITYLLSVHNASAIVIGPESRPCRSFGVERTYQGLDSPPCRAIVDVWPSSMINRNFTNALRLSRILNHPPFFFSLKERKKKGAVNMQRLRRYMGSGRSWAWVEFGRL